MKIYSAHRDYYDSIQAFDPDPYCVYERKREEIEIVQTEFDLIPQHNPLHKWGHGWQHFQQVTELILGFCGKLYPYLLVDNNNPDPNTYYGVTPHPPVPKKWLSKSPTGTMYFYDIETFRKELVKNDFFNPKRKKYDLEQAKNGVGTHGKFLKEWSDFESKMFVNLKTPVFVTEIISSWSRTHHQSDKVEVTLNPNLEAIEFYKVKNPFEAYQEIEQFLSGILGMNDPEMIQIADEDMIVKKGFNKMSFRKPPGKRKPRKQKITNS